MRTPERITLRTKTALFVLGGALLFGAAIGHYVGLNREPDDPMAGPEANDCRQLLRIQNPYWGQWTEQLQEQKIADCVLRMKQGRRR